MDSKDPPPFGYTFSTDFFEGSPTAFTDGGPSLLNDHEGQTIDDFFKNTDPFLAEAPSFSNTAGTADTLNDFDWAFVPPAIIHRVSTAIPDQTQLHHNFHPDPSTFVPDPLSGPHLTNTHDDLQAASTLFNNVQHSHQGPHINGINGRSYSVPGLPTRSNGITDSNPNAFHGVPMVNTPHGPMSEQLAALLPNHSENGSIDATVAAHISMLQHQQIPELARPKPRLKRSYTYGTDNAFNSSGFVVSSPADTEEAVTRRLLQDLRHADASMKQAVAGNGKLERSGSSGRLDFPIGLADLNSDGEEQSEEESSEEDNEAGRPTKKRRKGRNSTSASKADLMRNSPRKSISGARPGKNRKVSIDDNTSKKKRPSTAGQKRENLSEEQKRSNHILSEQKRRNLIKRGFDDLHDLVPEIRNGGLSKSSVLTEAANFLEKVRGENLQFAALIGPLND